MKRWLVTGALALAVAASAGASYAWAVKPYAQENTYLRLRQDYAMNRSNAACADDAHRAAPVRRPAERRAAEMKRVARDTAKIRPVAHRQYLSIPA